MSDRELYVLPPLPFARVRVAVMVGRWLLGRRPMPVPLAVAAVVAIGRAAFAWLAL